MNLTSKSRYGLKIMMDLAFNGKNQIARRHEIAQRQGIPEDYMDQIMMRLREHHLVSSVRGRTGGYHLTKSPALISLWEVFSAVEDSIYPVECLSSQHDCHFEEGCVAASVWQEIYQAVSDALGKMTLQDMVERHGHVYKMFPLDGIRECRVGKGGASLEHQL